MNFDSTARWYALLERVAFGGELQRARIEFLDEVASAERVLIVGEGDGRFLQELLRRSPKATVVCVDSSACMLERARRRVHEDRRARFFCADFAYWDPEGERFDLIVTHFFLDCFPEKKLTGIVRKLSNCATENASWLLADFHLPASGFARLRGRIWLALMYLFFRVTTRIEADHLTDAAPFIESAGWVLAERKYLLGRILKSERWVVRRP